MTPASEDLQRIARAMLKDFDVIKSDIANQVWKNVPPYSSVLVEQDDLTDRVQENILNVIMCLLEDRAPSITELDRSRQNGERRALQGVSQAALIQSFRQAERSLGDVFQSWCTKMQVKPAIARSGKATMISYLDSLERAMLEAFALMQQQISTKHALTEPTLMNRLATGASIAPAEIEHLAGALGIEDVDDTNFVGICATLVEKYDDIELQRIRHHIVFQLGSAAKAPVLSGIVLTDSGMNVAVFALPWVKPTTELAPLVTAALGETVLRQSVRATIGEPRVGLVQVGGSCRQAIATLEATRSTAVARQAVLYRDSLLEVIARRDPVTSRELYERYIGPLVAHDFLDETLRVYLATDLSIAETAERLHVHKNTIGYRLRRIQELTGIDLHSVRDIARIVLALEGAPTSRTS